ncbi:MAG TPA: nucleotide pyrophosphatase/phosphodiesterase family protein [Candidatus Paceibacterota bacterium]|nr:nucleotide pyrophosphatase/phosphodiesterase family protein [Candidatus Paceibacterota bacterium]
MVHHDVLHTIKRAKQHESFIYPYYGAYSIAEIPPSVRLWLGLPPDDRAALPFALRYNHAYRQVLFFFVDGLGFDHMVDYESVLPFFHRLKTRGDIYPLTTVFPSTTPAALTTLHTNKTPQEHGLPEWTVYFEEFDRIIEPLPFRAHLSHEREGLSALGADPESLYEGRTFYEELADDGVCSYVYIKEEIAVSSYSAVSQRGSASRPFRDLDDLMQTLTATITEEAGPAYHFLYWDRVDSIEHVYGPRSKEHISALQELSGFLEAFTAKLSQEGVRDTLFVLSSDHGQATIRNEDIIYLNDYVDLEANYTYGPNGKAIYPTGAPHDVFLHIYEGKRAATINYLKRQLEGKAEVITTNEAIDRGLYGLGTPSARFMRRVGDVLILPYEGYHVWYKHAPDVFFGQLGIHGGLSQREMIVPLAIAPLADLLHEVS